MIGILLFSLVFGSMVALIGMAVYLYDSASITAVLYLGWVVLLLGLAVLIAHVVLRRRGKVPKGGTYLATTVLVNEGIYTVVRHPIYLGLMLIAVALTLMSQYWVSGVLCLLVLCLMSLMMLGEEQYNQKKFGKEYEAYMREVPRMNLPLGVVRAIRRRRSEERETPGNS